MWRPEATSVRDWREATIFLGRIPTTFQIRLYSERPDGHKGDVAIDQLEFLDCALPCESLKNTPLLCRPSFYGVMTVQQAMKYNKLIN